MKKLLIVLLLVSVCFAGCYESDPYEVNKHSNYYCEVISSEGMSIQMFYPHKHMMLSPMMSMYADFDARKIYTWEGTEGMVDGDPGALVEFGDLYEYSEFRKYMEENFPTATVECTKGELTEEHFALPGNVTFEDYSGSDPEYEEYNYALWEPFIDGRALDPNYDWSEFDLESDEDFDYGFEDYGFGDDDFGEGFT